MSYFATSTERQLCSHFPGHPFLHQIYMHISYTSRSSFFAFAKPFIFYYWRYFAHEGAELFSTASKMDPKFGCKIQLKSHHKSYWSEMVPIKWNWSQNGFNFLPLHTKNQEMGSIFHPFQTFCYLFDPLGLLFATFSNDLFMHLCSLLHHLWDGSPL